MSSLSEWLREIGCVQYAQLLQASGYSSPESLKALSEAQLESLGVFDGNHRRQILHKAQNEAVGDLDSALDDLTSVIADLEAFTVPTKVDISTNPSTPQQQRAQKALSVAMEPAKPLDTDFDLDSLLSDLQQFNPSETVAATHPPPPQPHPQPISPPPWQSVRSPSSSTPSSHSTPVHNHTASSGPSPPITPSHRPPPLVRSRTETSPPVPRKRYSGHGSPAHMHPRSMTTSSMNRKSQEEPGTPTIVTVPQPELGGASDQISQEEEIRRLDSKAQELRSDQTLTDVEREERMKEERMKIGIEKMKLAHKKRVAIKVFNVDRSNKTVVVEEGMTSGMVCHLLVVKNHFDESPNWVILEQLGDVSLERELEDHEQVVDVYSTWPREHSNVFLFKQNEKKYDLFEDPIKYFPEHLKTSYAATTKVTTLERAEKARKILLQEYFSSTSRVPELEGWLHLKDGYKKSWKKVFFILRASGLYYSTKGKQKGAKYLQLLVHFDEYELYHGINFKKTLKAPTQFCFALRPIPRQFVPGPKDIKVLCADEESTALSWTAGIRLSKYGLQLRDNFHKAKLTQFKLEDLGAPEGSKPKADDRASKLVGLRLEKHMDKIREQYIAQREEEEVKKQHYHSPKMGRRDEGSEDGASVGEGSRDGSIDQAWQQPTGRQSYSASPASHTPERSPEPPGRGPPPPVAPRPTPPPTAPRPSPPAAAPKPPKRADITTQEGPPPASRGPPQPPAPYNPYPPPSQPAPPPRMSPNHSAYAAGQNSYAGGGQSYYPTSSVSQPPPPALPRPNPQSLTPDQSELFDFPWYHGAIPRDEAVRRLEALGGYDGTYLVRDSSTVPNSFVLTMFSKGVSKNFQIMPMDHPSGGVFYCIDDGPSFRQIDELLRHYMQDPDRLPCRLTDFCPRPPTRMTEC